MVCEIPGFGTKEINLRNKLWLWDKETDFKEVLAQG